jgi:transposase-like protein
MNRILAHGECVENAEVAQAANILSSASTNAGGFVFTEIVPDVQRQTLQAVIRGRVSLDSIIHSDGWRGYNALVDTGFDKHYRVNHSKNEFVAGDWHINGIESFWSFAKTRLQKFNGVSKQTFYLHLKECQWRFNNRSKNLYLELLKLFRENPL